MNGRLVFFCDHAVNYVPPELNNLGLPESELQRHIAWDIGAAGVTRILADIFGAPAVFSTVSRLVIDCNRYPFAEALIPEISDGIAIPGNAGLSAAQREMRLERWFRPYHDAIEAVLGEREATTVSIHSMTESLAGVARPWQIALSSYRDRSLADPVLAALRAPGDIEVGDNEPYDLDPSVDYSTPFHALRRGLPHLQIEFRQDEIALPSGQDRWARRLAGVLAALQTRAL
jgi:predicted N-formylglutamate amidohydrolase